MIGVQRLKLPQGLRSFALALAVMPAFTFPAYAACTNPVGVEGDIVYNADQNVPQVCTQGSWVAVGVLNPSAGGSGCSNPTGDEGDIVYNADIYKPQYCDGDDWVEMLGTVDGCSSNSSCTDVGDVCADGSLFAGFMIYNDSSCEALYVTDNNQSTNSQWRTASGNLDVTNPDDAVDGQYNRDNRVGSGTYPSFDLCESNTYHSKSDWYLPARAELNLLWLNSAAIDANAAGNFTTSNYWSSTEGSAFNAAWQQSFSDGEQDDFTKTSYLDVRCVRRD